MQQAGISETTVLWYACLFYADPVIPLASRYSYAIKQPHVFGK